MTFRSPAKARITGSAKVEGVVSYRGEGYVIHCLNDGGQASENKVFPNVPDTLRARRLTAAGLSAIETEFSVYLLQHDSGQIDLIDTGCGALFGDKGGALPSRLAALNVAPSDVDRLIFTHLHSDHCGGALNDGAVVFGGAEVILHQDEASHWAGSDATAAKVLNAYAGRIRTVSDGESLGSGMTAWPLPGHTPGHMGGRLAGGVVLVGDILHSAELQLPDPTVSSIYDVDPQAALASRQSALAEIADAGLIWSGSHLVGEHKFLKLQKDGAGYRAIPLT